MWKKIFLKIEYLESLLELVLKKICRPVFRQDYAMLSLSVEEAVLRVFANVAVQMEYLKWKMRYKSLKMPVYHFSNAFLKIWKIELNLNTSIYRIA